MVMLALSVECVVNIRALALGFCFCILFEDSGLLGPSHLTIPFVDCELGLVLKYLG